MPDIFNGFNAAVVATNVFWSLIGLALYVMLAFGLMQMGQKTRHPYPWLAWIPAANLFLLSHLAGAARKRVAFAFLLLALMSIGAAIFSSLFGAIGHLPYAYGATGFSVFLAVVAWMTGIAAYVLYSILVYHIYKCFKPNNATVFTVLSVIFWFLGPIFIFVASFGTPDQAQAAASPRPQGPVNPPSPPTSPPPSGPPTFTPPSGY